MFENKKSPFVQKVLGNIELKENEVLMEEMILEFPDVFTEGTFFTKTGAKIGAKLGGLDTAYKGAKIGHAVDKSVPYAAGAAGAAGAIAAYKLYKNWKAKKEAAKTAEQKAIAQKKMDEAKAKIKKEKEKIKAKKKG